MVRTEGFDPGVELPPGLELAHIRRAVQYIQRELDDFVDIYYEQANLFSALVGIYGARALDKLSPYEKRRHVDAAQQRFPDLKRRGSREPPPPQHCLESKASKRPWALQSHFDHAGWYIVWRYLIHPTRSLEPDTSVVLWRVEVAFLGKGDWKYERSSAGEAGGGRTHTFGVRNPATKFRDRGVYVRSDVKLIAGKPTVRNAESASDV